MKILLIQEKGRHLENYEYREALNLKRALDTKGIDCVVWGLNYENFSTPFDIISKDCDVIILIENYESGNWIPDLSKVNKLKLFWSVDSHCVPMQHIATVIKHNIDIVLHAVYGHEKYFKNKVTHWFPNAYPSDLIYPMNDIIKKYDIGFCGNVNNRNSWIDLIASNFKLKKDIFVIGNEMVKTINEYKIHFNRNIADDINYRTFETLGCNTFILTNETPGLNQLFEIGKNIITYNNENDLLDKIKFYLENDSEREQTTKLGYEHVTNNHTFFNRADLLLKIIKENI